MDKELAKTRRERLVAWVLGLAVIVLLAQVGLLAGDSRARVADIEIRERLLRKAWQIAKNVNPEFAKQLTLTAADKGTPAFERFREQLIEACRAVPNARRLYCMSERDGRIVFAADIGFGDRERANASAEPGEVYDDASAGLLRSFGKMQPFTEGPYTNKRGTFVSAFAPIFDRRTGEALVVIGLDIEASDWQCQVNAARREPMCVALAAMLAFSGGIFLLHRHNRRSKPDSLKLKAWILAPTATAALTALTLVGTYRYSETAEESRRDMLRLTERTRREWNHEVKSHVQLLRMQIDQIAGNSAMLQAWQDRDLPALTALAQPPCEQLKRDYDITHFSFITPDRVCFLRAQAPAQHGDAIDRPTLLMAEQTGKDSWGLDVGSLGELSLRYVKPWRHNGRLIGYLELAIECGRLVGRLAGEMEADILFVTRKECTTREKFEAARRVYGLSGQWDAFSGLVVDHQTTPYMPSEIMGWLNGHCASGESAQTFNARQGESCFACGLVHLSDAAGREVADILVVQDMTVQAATVQSNLLMSLGLAALLVGGILALLWSVTVMAERQLSNAFATLRASQERFSQVAETNGEMIWDVDARGLFTYVSRTCKTLLGYREDEVVGRLHFYDLCSEECREQFRRRAFEVFDRKEPFKDLQNQVVTKDGRVLVILTNAVPVLHADGTLRGYRGSDQDITDRTFAEKRDRLDKIRANALFELSQMTGCRVAEIAKHAMESAVKLTESKIGYVAFVNEDETVLTMHSWSDTAMQECTMSCKPLVYRVEDTGLWGEAIRQRKPVVTNDYAATNPLKKGIPREHVPLIRHVNIPVFDGGKIVAVAGVGNKDQDYVDEDVRQMTLMMDGMWRILCRRRVENSLRESEKKHRLLIEHAVAGIAVHEIVLDAAGRPVDYVYLDANPAFETHTGLRVADVLGRRVTEVLPGIEKTPFIEIYGKVVLTGEPASVEEYCEPLGRHYAVNAYRLAEGRFATVFADITDRKKAEENLLRTKAELQLYVAALESSNRALEEFNHLAESATRAKSDFLANMSHEIRTPMTAILGYADLILEENFGRATQGHIEVIKRNGEHLLGLINDILDLSKIEAGKMQIEPIRCSPCELLAEVALLMRVRADAKGLKLETEVVGPLPETVLTDPLRLRQVLVNLVGNAIKFTNRGEVRVAAHLGGHGGSPRLHFDVTDTGIGMNPSQIERLFKPFSQVDNSLTRKFSGTGLGLCISKRLTEALGGDIVVHSEPGKGSAFSVIIDPGPLDGIRMLQGSPGAASQPQSIAATAAAEKVVLGGRILLAEDGPDNQRLISFVLRKAGIEVTVVENGWLAVEQASAALEHGQPFDIILMDIQMPVMDGYTATRQLREQGYTGAILALTAHAMEGDGDKCRVVGCDDYATKPIDRQKFLATVARWMAPDRTTSLPRPSTNSAASTAMFTPACSTENEDDHVGR